MFPQMRANVEKRSTALLSAVPEQLDFGHVVAVLIVALSLIPFANPLWLMP
jgi:hypothetical protein